MLCQDTNGRLPAVHVSDEILALAQDLYAALDAIATQGHGDGEIKLTVSKGKIPFIDWTFRQFRKQVKR